MKRPKPVREHLLYREDSEIAADILDEVRAVAFHLSNLFDLLRLPKTNGLGAHRVGQVILDATAGRVDAFTILDLVDQEDSCREVERMPARAPPAWTH